MYCSHEKLQGSAFNARGYQDPSSLLDRRSNRPDHIIVVGARDSPLSIAQTNEVLEIVRPLGILFKTHLIKTMGDLDTTTPLWDVKTDDFFTRELDQLLIYPNKLKNRNLDTAKASSFADQKMIDESRELWLASKSDSSTCLGIDGTIRIAIHSAKDMPKTLHPDLSLLALTKGVDGRDSLVMRPHDTIDSLPYGARVGTSSLRRIQMVPKLRPDFIPASIRGTIQDRLQLLFHGEFDALIMAQAALIRLHLTSLNHVILPFPSEPLQGQLAVVGRRGDTEMAELFQQVDVRKAK